MNKKALALLKAKGMSDDECRKLMKAMEDDDAPDAGGEPKDDDEVGDEGDEQPSLVKSLDAALAALGRLGYTAPEPASAQARLDAQTDVGLAKSMDATGFVKSLVDATGAHLDELGAGVAEIGQSVAVSNTATLATGKLVLGLQKSLETLNERIDALMAGVTAPAQPRSTGARPLAKAFGGGGGDVQLPTRAEVETALEKAMRDAGDAGDRPRAATLAKSLSTYSGSDGRIVDSVAAPIVQRLIEAKKK